MNTRSFRAPSSVPSPTGFAPKNLLLDMNLDILYNIMECLDNETLAVLAQTNRFFYRQCRGSVAFDEAVWQPLVQHHDDGGANAPPVFNTRGGVLIGTKFYFPFMTMQPTCYVLDLTTSRWSCHDLDVEHDPTYQPFVTSAVAIRDTLYLFGGRKLQTYQLSSTLYKLDVTHWTLKKVEHASGAAPRPRHEHSVDVLSDRYLAIFGGLCYHSVGENDLFLYDTETDTWLEPTITGRTPHVRFGHASVVIGKDLYIFGGSQIEDEVNIVYDDFYRLDCSSWVWYKYDPPEAYRYRRMSPPLSDTDIDMSEAGPSSPAVQIECLTPTTGQQPRERFHCGMSVVRRKLVIFGGHTISTDHDDNPEPYDYPLRSVDVFCTVRNHWTRVQGHSKKSGAIYPQDICYGVVDRSLLSNRRGHGIVVVGQQKVFKKSSRASIRSRSSGSSSANEAVYFTDVNHAHVVTKKHSRQDLHLASPLSSTIANRKSTPSLPYSPTDQVLRSPTKENLNPFGLMSSSPTDPSPPHIQKRSASPLVRATSMPAFDDEGPPSSRSSKSNVSQYAVPSRTPVVMGTTEQQPRSFDSVGSTRTRATLNSGSTQRSNSSSGSADHWFCKDNRRFSLAPFRMVLMLDGELEAEKST